MNEIIEWFRDPAHSAFSAFAVSLAAVVFSFIAWFKSRKMEKKLLEIEEAREEDRLAEKQKANLTAEIITKESPRSGSIKIDRKCYLQIENKGLGEARNIKLVLDNKPVMEHPGISKPQSEVKRVGPESKFRHELAVTGGPNVPSYVEITWEDDSGELGFYGTTLTL